MRPNILTLSIAAAFGGKLTPRPRTTALRYMTLKERFKFMLPPRPAFVEPPEDVALDSPNVVQLQAPPIATSKVHGTIECDFGQLIQP